MQLNTGFVPFSEVNDFAALLSSGETEPNNTPGTAPLLAGFGTGAGDDSEADISLNQDGVLTSSVDNSSTDVGDQIAEIIRTELEPHYAELAKGRSSEELEANALYQRLRPFVEEVLTTPETGDFSIPFG